MSNVYLVTGGAGFIGSHMVDLLLECSNNLHDKIICIDDLHIGSNICNLPSNENEDLYKHYTFYKEDISNFEQLEFYFKNYNFTHIIHMAAESHVDRSIDNSNPFIQSNIIGTYNILECVRKYCPNAKMVYVSTDEVYGQLKTKYESGFIEASKLDPRSPYAASKACGDLLVNAWRETYNLDIITTRCCNNYGPRQHSEKFIPTVLRSLLNGKKIPVYGNGENIREWIHVRDHCDAIWEILHKKKHDTKVYNIAQQNPNTYSNLELVKILVHLCYTKKLIYSYLPEDYIEFVEDRKGHDFCYKIDSSFSWQLESLKKSRNFTIGLMETIDFYVEKEKELDYNI